MVEIYVDTFTSLLIQDNKYKDDEYLKQYILPANLIYGGTGCDY